MDDIGSGELRPTSPTAFEAEQFLRQGHHLIDQLGAFIAGLKNEPLKVEHSADAIRRLIGSDRVPERGLGEEALNAATTLLCKHAVSTSHPRFWGYIMGAANPQAALADTLAGVISAPMTSYATSALTVAMEAQTVQWIAALIGYNATGGGLFLSGGSAANFCALRLALQRHAGFDVRKEGIAHAQGASLRIYATRDAHSSTVAAAELAGLGQRAIHWIDSDSDGCMDIASLRQRLHLDRKAGLRPVMVVAMAGSTSIGAIDPLGPIARVCNEASVWLHVDAAYGGFAALSADAPAVLSDMREADSVAVDPHKWLYMPADIGCLLTRHQGALYDAFRQGADYYADNDEQRQMGGPEMLQFRDLGPQTTRAFRALKVRVVLQSIGAEGYRRMIGEDIRLARELYLAASREPELEPLTNSLSITTFRFVPDDLRREPDAALSYLNQLNQAILQALHESGAFYPSHTTVRGMLAIRVCIVNFNTTGSDIKALLKMTAELGRQLDQKLRNLS